MNAAYPLSSYSILSNDKVAGTSKSIKKIKHTYFKSIAKLL